MLPWMSQNEVPELIVAVSSVMDRFSAAVVPIAVPIDSKGDTARLSYIHPSFPSPFHATAALAFSSKAGLLFHPLACAKRSSSGLRYILRILFLFLIPAAGRFRPRTSNHKKIDACLATL